MSKEIERKWLMNGFPEDDSLELIKEAIVFQSYLSIDPEIRIKKVVSKEPTYFDIAKKSNGTLVREELEKDITSEMYRILSSLTDGESIVKVYKKYRMKDGHVLECSFVDDTFYYAEIEFDSEDEANSFIFPFTGTEVTDRSEYKMKKYWYNTRVLKYDGMYNSIPSDIADKSKSVVRRETIQRGE